MDEESKSRALVEQAHMAKKENRWDDAHAALTEAVDSSSGLELAIATRELAELERNMGERDSSIKNYKDAVALYRDLDEPLRLAHTIRHLGDVLSETGDLERARPNYVEALRIYDESKDANVLDVTNAKGSMARLLSRIDEREEAIELWKECAAGYGSLGIMEGVKEAKAWMRKLEARQKD